MLTIQKILDSLKVFDPLIQQVRDIIQGLTVNNDVGQIVSDIIYPQESGGSPVKSIVLYSETDYPVIELISAYLVQDNLSENCITNIMTDTINEMEDDLYKTTLNIVVNLGLTTLGVDNPEIHIKYLAIY